MPADDGEGNFGVSKKVLPEVLLPRELSEPQRYWFPRHEGFWNKPGNRLISISAVFVSGASWLLANFFQLRGYVNLFASRIDLAILAFLAFIFFLVLAFSLPRQGIRISCIGLAAVFGLLWMLDRLTLPSLVLPIPRPALVSQPTPLPQPQLNPSTAILTIPKRTPKLTPIAPPQASQQSQPILLTARVNNPRSPVIVVSNTSNKVAQGIVWELMMFRKRDSLFITLPTQSMGFVKAMSRSASSAMFTNIPMYRENVIPLSYSELHEGDDITGTLILDCPDCAGMVYIVHFEWMQGGWLAEMRRKNGMVPPGPQSMTNPEDVRRYIQGLELWVSADDRVPIL